MRWNKRRKNVLISCCGAHVIQDGLSSTLFVLLPVLAQTFGLSYSQVGILRALNNGAMALLEMSSGVLSERFGERNLLAFGLICSGLGYVVMALSSSIWALGACLLIVGIGGAFQHALSSSTVSEAFESDGRRSALGLYNSSGDAGKLIFTGLFSLLAWLGFAWQGVISVFGGIALVGSGAVFFALYFVSAGSRYPALKPGKGQFLTNWGIQDNTGFLGLCAAVFLDTAIQAGFLTFLAFFIVAKQVPMSLATLAVTITLVGGMMGKAAGGFLAERMGIRYAFTLVHCLTACGIIAVLFSGKVVAFCLLPLLGVCLQGSTSITYGAVGDLVHKDKVSRGFSIIYSVSSLSGLFGPIAFGLFSDNYGIEATMVAMSAISLLAIPPIILLRPKIEEAK